MRNSSLIVSAAVTVSAILGISAASAADLPAQTYTKAPAIVATVYNWTGFYAGGSVGADWQRGDTTLQGDPAGTILVGNIITRALTAGAIPQSASQRGTGFIGGLTAGYNIQSDRFVFGVEGDASWLNSRSTSIVSTNVAALGFPPIVTTTETKANWLGTFRGRVGLLAAPQTLLYATGGLAAGGVSGSSSVAPGPVCFNNAFCAAGAGSATLWGWTVGGGLEQAFGQQWTVKFEYLYYDLGSFSYKLLSNSFVGIGAPLYDANTKVTGQIARIGLNYRFGGPVLAKY
jgi:outer membrane immunogenic protein